MEQVVCNCKEVCNCVQRKGFGCVSFGLGGERGAKRLFFRIHFMVSQGKSTRSELLLASAHISNCCGIEFRDTPS